MSENKRYYWLQLKKDFFKTRAMKKLRSIAGGDTYTIIYLKMQLLSLENGGFLFHEGVEDNMLEDVALDIDESVDNVRMTFQFLEKCNLIELRNDEMYLPEVNENMGSETASAQRVRRFRARRDSKALPSNINVTSSNVELEKELYKKSKSYNIESDFTDIYSFYPCKKGKSSALKKYIEYRRLKTIPENQILINHIESSKKTKQWIDGYIPHFSTWMNQRRWEDEIDQSEIVLSEDEQKAEIRREIEERRNRV